MGMVNDKVQTQLLKSLDTPQENAFFFYQEFNMTEQTQASSRQFVDQLVDKFYGENNQRIPFARIEEGYVQCIPDPKVSNGFITVQIVKSIAKTENKKFSKKKAGQEDFYEVETDEARAVQDNM